MTDAGAVGTGRAELPVLLAVDDEADVLRAIERDLRRHYADHYRVMRAVGGAEGLETLDDLKARGRALALVISDQRMPGVDGVTLLRTVRDRFPEAKLVLLTAYADTEVAIKAINDVRLDYYILKPWDPPEEHLYPALDDVLGEWDRDYVPPFTGIRVVGHRWSPDSHVIRDFLARYRAPYAWLDIDSDAEARQILDAVATDAAAKEGIDALPLVILPDGRRLCDPSVTELAEALGLPTRVDTVHYDIAIVGAGPAGLAAAVYASTEGLRAAVVEREAPGGQAGQSSLIENYLGFPNGLSGGDLARRAYVQARRFGADVYAPVEVKSLEVCDPYRVIHLGDGQSITAESVVIASGVSYRRLGVPGAEELTNRGIYYGAGTVDAPQCTGEEVAIVGGANSAGQAALNFARYAHRVTLVVRAESLAKGMSAYLVDRIEKSANIDVRTNTVVERCDGTDHLTAIHVLDNAGHNIDRIEVTSLYVFIGAEPCTDWLDGMLDRDDHGFVLTGADLGDRSFRTAAGAERDPYLLETSIPGVFAVGDVRHRSMKRVASAVGEGSTAVSFVHQYLDR